jgi:hypothetical protein
MNLMSDNVLKLIATSPQCTADHEALKEASEVLACFFPEAGEVTFTSTEHVRFIDPGQNLERIVCPACGTEVDMAWWQKAMSTASQTHFTELSVELPCCKTLSSLNELQYDWPAGFARFVLEVRNPSGRVKTAQLEQLETILQCSLREIWAHY